MDNDNPARDLVLIRNLRPDDIGPITAIDEAAAGRRRDRFLAIKMKQAFADTGIAVSLAAELDDHVVGFLLVEPAAVLDVVGVHPDYRGRHVASALVDQLRTNLLGLGIRTLQTEVSWRNPELITFFQHEGFALAPRLCLDLDLARTRT